MSPSVVMMTMVVVVAMAVWCIAIVDVFGMAACPRPEHNVPQGQHYGGVEGHHVEH